jgi:hypothetical protein
MKEKAYIKSINEAGGTNVYRNFMMYLKRHSPEPITPEFKKFLRLVWWFGSSEFQQIWGLDIDMKKPVSRLAEIAFKYTDKVEYADALVDAWCTKHHKKLSHNQLEKIFVTAWKATESNRAAYQAKQKKVKAKERPYKPVKGFEKNESMGARKLLGKNRTTRELIAEFLVKHPKGGTPLEVAEGVKLSRSNVRQTLGRMLKAGEAIKNGEIYTTGTLGHPTPYDSTTAL